MKNYIFKINLSIIVCLFIAVSCKKEYPPLPYAEMVNFNIKGNNGEVIKGAIENNEITLYWPPEQAVPENITPVITVAEKATVHPASGSTVPFTENTTFTVTAEDGTVLKYRLRPVINSTKPYITNINMTAYGTKLFAIIQEEILISGDYFNTDPGKTQVSFIATDGSEKAASITSATPLRLNVTSSIPGLYKQVKVVTNNRTAIADAAFEIMAESPNPSLRVAPFSNPITLKRGQQFTWSGGANMEKVNLVQLRNSVSRVITAIRLVAATKTGWELEIPADFPPGTYNLILYTYPNSDYYLGGRATLSVPVITITD